MSNPELNCNNTSCNQEKRSCVETQESKQSCQETNTTCCQENKQTCCQEKQTCNQMPTYVDNGPEVPVQEKLLWHMKRMGLATIGAMALLQEESEKVVQKLVEKGENAGKQSRQWAHEMFEKGRTQTRQTVHVIESGFENLEKILGKMNIPTRNDLEELSKKVDALAQKVESLNEKKQS